MSFCVFHHWFKSQHVCFNNGKNTVTSGSKNAVWDAEVRCVFHVCERKLCNGTLSFRTTLNFLPPKHAVVIWEPHDSINPAARDALRGVNWEQRLSVEGLFLRGNIPNLSGDSFWQTILHCGVLYTDWECAHNVSSKSFRWLEGNTVAVIRTRAATEGS